MVHEWVAIALGVLFSIVGWLLLRFIGHFDALEASLETKARQIKVDELERHTNRHSVEIRDTRSAISRIEGKLDMQPFTYTDGEN